jgi:two-component system CheB/CheR fusion protein
MPIARSVPERRSERPRRSERLVDAARQVAAARDLTAVIAATRRAARALTGADGVTFVLREGDVVHYADEEAIGPLWKGRRFPADACISGWAETVVIEDVFADDRVPHDVYRPTFVKSLAMVPVVCDEPVAAIGAYWATRRRPAPREVGDLQALASLASVALVNAKLDAELRGAVRARDEFIAIASHELRTPLSALQIQLHLATRAVERGADPGELRRALQRAQRGTGRLTGLVEALLDARRAGREAIALEPEPVELVELAQAVVDRVCEANPSARVTLSADGAPRGTWDRLWLERVVENLVHNAVKFGGSAPVDVQVEAGPAVARLAVIDRGIGIAPEDQARIFGAFERAVSTRHYGGFGLGLWIARQAVDAHGGTISVESSPGAGSTFTVRLPLARGA